MKRIDRRILIEYIQELRIRARNAPNYSELKKLKDELLGFKPILEEFGIKDPDFYKFI